MQLSGQENKRKRFMDKTRHSIIKRVAFIGNYLPRQCGIATFTTDLCEAVADEYKGTACIALPVNDTEAGYEYPPRVRFELAEKDWQDRAPKSIKAVHQVAGTDPKAANTYEDPNQIIATSVAAPAVQDNSATLVLPPLSFTVVEVAL